MKTQWKLLSTLIAALHRSKYSRVILKVTWSAMTSARNGNSISDLCADSGIDTQPAAGALWRDRRTVDRSRNRMTNQILGGHNHSATAQITVVKLPTALIGLPTWFTSWLRFSRLHAHCTRLVCSLFAILQAVRPIYGNLRSKSELRRSLQKDIFGWGNR